MSGSEPGAPSLELVRTDRGPRPAPDALPCPGPGVRGVNGCPSGEALAWEWVDAPNWSTRPGFWTQGDQVRCVDCELIRKAPPAVASEVLGDLTAGTPPETIRAYEDQRIEQAMANAGIPERWRGFRFDRHASQKDSETWDQFRERLRAGPPDTLGITRWNHHAARALREQTPDTISSALITGPVGGGKSTLLATAAAHLSRHGVVLSWTTEAELFDRIRRQGRGGASIIRYLVAVPVLFIDDLGSRAALKDWQRDAIEELIVGRYNEERPILASSNLLIDGPDGIASPRVYGERVASRLVEMLGGWVDAGKGPDGEPLKRIPGYLGVVGRDWRTDQQHRDTSYAAGLTCAADVATPPAPPAPRDGKSASSGD